MNAADRSVALVDQALRRRFSFLEMAPGRGGAGGVADGPPAGGRPGVRRAAWWRCSRRLNARLRARPGPARQVGHSYFITASTRRGWKRCGRDVLRLLPEEYATLAPVDAGRVRRLDAAGEKCRQVAAACRVDSGSPQRKQGLEPACSKGDNTDRWRVARVVGNWTKSSIAWIGSRPAPATAGLTMPLDGSLSLRRGVP